MTIPYTELASLRDLVALRPALKVDVPSTSDSVAPPFCSDDLAELAARTVLIAAASQAASAAALIALDGVAARLVICPPDFSTAQLAAVAEQAAVDAIVTDRPALEIGTAVPVFVRGSDVAVLDLKDLPRLQSEWILPTSGTTGRPKLVAHSFSGLIGAISLAESTTPAPVWATFYDIRRYGGLQIFLRACVAGASLVLTDPSETLGDFMTRCGVAGVTHLTGTPSHWRRLLMSGHSSRISPAYVRLSGEIADRSVLEALRAAFPGAAIVHAYASTEAGVAFEVSDGREGFPASYLDGGLAGIDLKIEDGTLRIRSGRTAGRYVGATAPALLDAERFVDTDDVVELIGDRCFFRGRRSGVINIGGNKVHPEEVERVINLHPAVSMSRVKSRRNPILGDLIVADVVLKPDRSIHTTDDSSELRNEILATCRRELARHKVPVTLAFPVSLPLIGSGKMGRQHA